MTRLGQIMAYGVRPSHAPQKYYLFSFLVDKIRIAINRHVAKTIELSKNPHKTMDTIKPLGLSILDAGIKIVLLLR